MLLTGEFANRVLHIAADSRSAAFCLYMSPHRKVTHRRLHIFNPETDYALASGSPYYTPPAHVVEVRRQNALLPALYAASGDAILLLDDIDDVGRLPHYDDVTRKGIAVASLQAPEGDLRDLPGFKADPWGWNPQIRHLLTHSFSGLSGIPSEERIDNIRALSHRRTTILMHRAMKEYIAPEITEPIEISDSVAAIEAFRRDRHLFFKAPWSSSGRGILLTDDLELRHVEPWIKGIIRRQGSVMMEKAYDRTLDFATEWILTGGNAKFMGYSVFNVSRRGKYHSNVRAPQQDLLQMISAASPEWNESYLDCQRKAIEQIFGAAYDGPLGIDMLVTVNGSVNPSVEINLRHTMGMLDIITDYNYA